MIRELTKMKWERVDVSFRGTVQRFLAHNTIQASVHYHHYYHMIITGGSYSNLVKKNITGENEDDQFSWSRCYTTHD